MPEVLWKAYIDFEIEEGEREAARALYERLIALSGHVKVWISYATFEAEPIPLPRAEREEDEEEEEDEEAERKMVPGDPTLARGVFERGYRDLKSKSLVDEVRGLLLRILPSKELTHFVQRVALLEVWKTFEQNYGTEDTVAKVQAMMPFAAKKQIVDPETGQAVEGMSLFFFRIRPGLTKSQKRRLPPRVPRRREREEPDVVQVLANGACVEEAEGAGWKWVCTVWIRCCCEEAG
jgi:crooked neck